MRISIVEQEIVILIILLCSSLGFMVGSVLSPSSRMKGKEIGYWRGLTGDYKKQLKAEKRNNEEGGLEDILAGLLIPIEIIGRSEIALSDRLLHWK